VRLNDGRDFRRAVAVHCYAGSNGHGKTLGMVFDTLPDLDAGVPVLSTVRLTDWRDPRPCRGVRDSIHEGDGLPCDVSDVSCDGDHSGHLVAHPSYIPLRSFGQLMRLRKGVVLLDEITSSFGSRDTMGLPKPVITTIQQLRKSDRVVRYTSPAYMNTDILLRRVTLGLTLCRGYFPARLPGRQWRSNRGFRWLTYDAKRIEDFSESDRASQERNGRKRSARVRPEVMGLHWGPASGVFDAFDTFGEVAMLGSSDESGTCYECGGSIARRKCAGHDAPGVSLSPAGAFVPIAV